jgi:beta-lactamase regulating signal transducer with metallopeptidase domain/uncharacterized coiled-coil DUF342 family protein
MAGLETVRWSSSFAVLIDTSLKVFVLLALAAGLELLLRKGPARQRSMVWSIALIGAVLIPVAAHLLPVWPIASLPTLQPPVSAVIPVFEAETVAMPVAAASVPQTRTRLEPGQPAVAAEPHRRVNLRLEQWLAAQRLPFWVTALWLMGAATVLLRQLVSLIRIHALARRAQAPKASFWQPLLNRCSRQLGLGCKVRLLLSPEIATPVTWGTRHPVILLPQQANQWCYERCQVVLQHELVHIKRADWLIRLIGRVACAVYWFNPLTWLALRRLGTAQELACDAEVIALGTRPSTYATHLLAIARAAASPSYLRTTYALGMVRRLTLEKRIMTILKPESYKRAGMALVLPIALIMAGLVPALAAMHPWAEPAVPTDIGIQRQAQNQALKEILVEMKEVEKRMEPHLEQIEKIEENMQPVLEELEAAELEMEPELAEIEEFEEELEPYLKELEKVELEMEQYLEQMEDIELEMAPLLERIELLDIDEDISLRQLTEELSALHEQMAPFHEHMGEIHELMEPFHEQMQAIHEQMAPIHERMEHVHIDMEPFHEQMEVFHERMEPFHEEMEKIHELMEPFHEEMEALHERFQEELAVELALIIEQELGSATRSGAPFNNTAHEIVDSVSMINLEDDYCRIHCSKSKVTKILNRHLRSYLGGASEQEFDAAVSRVAGTIADLEISLR